MIDRRIDPKRSQRGFTLAEILVTTAIFAIIMIAALAVYDKSNQVFKQSTEAADMQQSTRIGFDKLVADIRMAGFDYSRGGIPTGDDEYEQPDEQIEYAGVTAVAFRANFDYNSDADHGNGLEDNAAGGENYTPKISGAAVFPYVTTGNDEIIIYALRSADNTKNTGSLSFWVDSDMPRSGYPGSPSNGKEKLLKVSSALCGTCGIDTTNANPPYTLYRMTVADVLANRPGTPVAENIRSLAFHYFTDRQGTTPVVDPGPVDIALGRNGDGSTFDATLTVNGNTVYTGAIGGAGQYDATNSATANVNDRSERSFISSIRVDLVGMNAQEDGGFVHPTETIAAIRHYRQYELHALVVPRNLGLTGYPEPTTAAPGPPTITGMCTGSCATPVICWMPPATGGSVLKYTLQWGLSATGPWTYTFDILDTSITTMVIPDDIGTPIDPSKTWYYQMFATNDSGQSQPSNPFSAVPKNSTKPLPPASLQATTATQPKSVDPTAIDNTITLTWPPATTNDPSTASLTCVGTCTGSGSAIPPEEKILYQIWRGTDRYFTIPSGGVPVLSFGTTPQPAGGPTMTFADSPAKSAFPPGTCVQYYYRIQAADRCMASNTYNVSGNTASSISIANPNDATTQPAVGGMAHDTGAQASAPASLLIDTVNSVCPKAPGPNCDIILKWPKVTTDISSNSIGVDRYKIIRSRKKIIDPSFILDTTFDPINGRSYVSVAGYSQNNNGIATYDDTTALAIDPSDGQPWYYQYTVQADDCSGGAISPAAVFPTACAINPTITAPGSANPGSSADAPGQAWVMDAGDTVVVTPPGSVVVSNVKFDVTAYPSGVSLGGYPVTIAAPGAPAGSYVITWANQTDLQIYQVKITITLTNGCKEIHIKYVQDQQATGCQIANLSRAVLNGPAPNTLSVSGGSGPLPFTNRETYTLTNNGTEAMTIVSIAITWAQPSAAAEIAAGHSPGDHSDMKMKGVTWHKLTPAPAVNSPDNFAVQLGPGTITRLTAGLIPAVPSIAPNGTFSMDLLFEYRKQDPAWNLSLISKVCLTYTIPSEVGVLKHCNYVGRSGSTVNPINCD